MYGSVHSSHRRERSDAPRAGPGEYLSTTPALLYSILYYTILKFYFYMYCTCIALYPILFDSSSRPPDTFNPDLNLETHPSFFFGLRTWKETTKRSWLHVASFFSSLALKCRHCTRSDEKKKKNEERKEKGRTTMITIGCLLVHVVPVVTLHLCN